MQNIVIPSRSYKVPDQKRVCTSRVLKIEAPGVNGRGLYQKLESLRLIWWRWRDNCYQLSSSALFSLLIIVFPIFIVRRRRGLGINNICYDSRTPYITCYVIYVLIYCGMTVIKVGLVRVGNTVVDKSY